MGDRENEDPMLFDTVDDAVGEIRNAQSPRPRGDREPGTRVAPDTSNRILDVSKEGFVKAFDPRSVEIRALEKLPLRQRVPGCSNHLVLARILARASWKTSSESCRATSPR